MKMKKAREYWERADDIGNTSIVYIKEKKFENEESRCHFQDNIPLSIRRKKDLKMKKADDILKTSFIYEKKDLKMKKADDILKTSIVYLCEKKIWKWRKMTSFIMRKKNENEQSRWNFENIYVKKKDLKVKKADYF